MRKHNLVSTLLTALSILTAGSLSAQTFVNGTATMTIPTVALLAVGLGIGLVPGLADHLMAAAERFQDRPSYVATVR